MIKSMTGYGKSEVALEGGALTIEIRTLNGKGCDVSLKSSLLPKDREMLVRQMAAEALDRGTIDIFLTWTPAEGADTRRINVPLALEYYRKISELGSEIGAPDLTKGDTNYLISTILRMPDVVDTARPDVVTDENWPLVEAGFADCLARVNEYRQKEGRALYEDVTGRVRLIGSIYDEVESMLDERLEAVRDRLLKAAEESRLNLDPSRLEQEMIFYLEKLDINEEKVRLRQHLQYFLDTIDHEPCPGKKLGFIIQEMGREINTTGSKANHAGIQKCVVRMKDELEKIREQSMNIL